MIPDERKKLAAYVKILRGLLKVFENEPGNVEGTPVRTLAHVIMRIETDFPGLAPPFAQHDYFSHDAPEIRESYYKAPGVRAYLLTVIPLLEAALDDDADEPLPVTEHREFKFISDAKLRAVVERDYAELQRAFVSTCYKSTIILAGGAIETILLDQLVANRAKALASPLAPRGKADIGRWDLADLIAVAVDIDVVPQGADKLSHSVREYRNLVHPGAEIRSGLVFDKEEARIAIEVLNMIHRELS